MPFCIRIFLFYPVFLSYKPNSSNFPIYSVSFILIFHLSFFSFVSLSVLYCSNIFFSLSLHSFFFTVLLSFIKFFNFFFKASLNRSFFLLINQFWFSSHSLTFNRFCFSYFFPFFSFFSFFFFC